MNNREYRAENVSVVSDALGRSSNRRLGLIQIFSDIASNLGHTPPPVETVSTTLEKLHAAVSIIDDLLDNEAVRNNVPTFHIRHSQPLAALSAVHLAFEATEECISLGVPSRYVIRKIMDMTLAEEADIGLIRKPREVDSLEWYEKYSGRKTAHELELIFNICLGEQSSRNTKPLESVRECVQSLGLLLQMTNDWRDFFGGDPLYRTALNDDFVVTYSLPFAIYAQKEPEYSATLLGGRFDRSSARGILNLYTTDDIRSACRARIDSCYDYLNVEVSNIKIISLGGLVQVAKLAVEGSFWEIPIARYA